MKVEYSPKAIEDLKSFEHTLAGFFMDHIGKLEKMPPRGHMRHGLPFFKEDVTRQARIAYTEKNGIIFIIHCFATHKEYERWYQSYR